MWRIFPGLVGRPGDRCTLHPKVRRFYCRITVHSFWSYLAGTGSQGVYDTCDWGEVTSRLCRARGSLNQVAGAIKSSLRQFSGEPDDRQAMLELAAKAKEIAPDLAAVVSKVAAVDPGYSSVEAYPTPVCPTVAATRMHLERMAGYLKQSIRFLGKCLHDMPLITDKIGCVLTNVKKRRILGELHAVVGALERTDDVLDEVAMFFDEPQQPGQSRRPRS